MKKYYIVSIKHTSKGDSALTLWGHDSAGYTFYEPTAGIYTDEDKEMANDVNVFVDKEIADKLWAKTMYDGKLRHVLRNNEMTRLTLGIDNKLMLPLKYKSHIMSF